MGCAVLVIAHCGVGWDVCCIVECMDDIGQSMCVLEVCGVRGMCVSMCLLAV